MSWEYSFPAGSGKAAAVGACTSAKCCAVRKADGQRLAPGRKRTEKISENGGNKDTRPASYK